MKIATFPICTLLIALLSGCYEWNQISSYPVACIGVQKDGSCNEGWTVAYRKTFEVLKERQEVIHWSPDLPLSPSRETNCVVRNIENWECRHSEIAWSFGFINGEYMSNPPDMNVVYVGKWTWWGVRLGSHFKKQRRLLLMPSK